MTRNPAAAVSFGYSSVVHGISMVCSRLGRRLTASQLRLAVAFKQRRWLVANIRLLSTMFLRKSRYFQAFLFRR